MPYRNPRESCRKVLGLLTVGRSVASLSADLQLAPSGPNRPRSRTRFHFGGAGRTAGRPSPDRQAGNRTDRPTLADHRPKSGVIDNVGTVAPLTVTDTHDTWIQENGNYVLSPLIQVR